MLSADPEKSEMLAILENFNFDHFSSLLPNWLKTGRMIWFIYGNIDQQVAIDISNQACDILNLKPVEKHSLTDCRCVMLPESAYERLNFTVQDSKNDNSCLVSYFQGP